MDELAAVVGFAVGSLPDGFVRFSLGAIGLTGLGAITTSFFVPTGVKFGGLKPLLLLVELLSILSFSNQIQS